MTIEEFSMRIKLKKENVEQLKEYIEQADRMDSVVFRYRKTEEYVGNYGYAEGDNSFSVDIIENNSGLFSSCFDELKTHYLQILEDELAKAENELKAMEEKKKKIEQFLEEDSHEQNS